MNALNRSAYWMPAMLNGAGMVVRPDYVSIYYKRWPAGSAECNADRGKCIALPRGLRYIFGHDMLSGQAATGAYHYSCQGPSAPGGGPSWDNLVDAVAKCGPGNQLGAVISSPECWDGKRLDSPNHRDHMAYMSYGDWGYSKCPATHPFVVPQFTMGAWYTRVAGEGQWTLSSDDMPGMKMKPGTTFHADWFGAWDDDILAKWTANCIDKLLSCTGGGLGDGTELRQDGGDFKWTANPRLVPAT